MKALSIVSRSIIAIERGVRWFVFITALVMMFYLAVHSLMAFFALNPPGTTGEFIGQGWLDSSLNLWKFFRNTMYMVLFLDLPIIALVTFIKEKSGDVIKGIRSIGIWFGLLLLVTFSFALAGLVFDLLMLGYTIILTGSSG